MRIHLDDLTLLPDLAGYLRRCNCVVEERGRHILDTEKPIEAIWMWAARDAKHPARGVNVVLVAVNDRGLRETCELFNCP